MSTVMDDFGYPDGLAAHRKAARGELLTDAEDVAKRAFWSARARAYRSGRTYRQGASARAAAKRQYDTNYYAENKAKIIARATAWRKDRRRDFALKVNQKAARFGVEGKLDWRDLVPDDCAYCGIACESWDHVVPMSRGGANTLENLVPCCWPCNQDKRNRTPDEWLATAA